MYACHAGIERDGLRSEHTPYMYCREREWETRVRREWKRIELGRWGEENLRKCLWRFFGQMLPWAYIYILNESVEKTKQTGFNAFSWFGLLVSVDTGQFTLLSQLSLSACATVLIVRDLKVMGKRKMNEKGLDLLWTWNKYVNPVSAKG